MTKEYTPDLQKLFLEMMLHDAQNYVRVQNIYNVDNFDRSLHDTAMFIKQHSDDHGALPTHEQIRAVTGVELKPVPEITESHNDWFLAEFEGFTKRQELERAILKSADLLEKGEYEPVEKIIKDAVQISLTKDMGTNYFEDPRARLMALKDNNGQISTGWPAMDRKLFGGMNKGELNIFAGGSGSGKSLFMQNLAVNWVTQGLNGVYLSLELSEGLSAMRIDSMLTNVSTKEVFKDLDTVEMKVKMVGKKAGNLQIKYMPAQSNVNDIRAYLKELQIKNGWRVDFLLIDYLDLLMPVSAKVSPSDLFVKDKYVSEELRNLAKELNCVFVTASQLNRGAVDEIEFDHSHISGGLSKINTADNVFGIFTSRAMRERGRYQIQLMKTRSSSGVGQKIDLGFNLESLRITDLGEDEDAPQQTTGSNIMNRIKSNGVVEASDNVATPTASVQSSKLKDMLAGLKQGS
jgi:archaellum biogenesis ATPase FlaH